MKKATVFSREYHRITLFLYRYSLNMYVLFIDLIYRKSSTKIKRQPDD